MDPARTDILGVGVSAINMPIALERIAQWIDQGRREYVAVTTVHQVMEAQRDEALRRVYHRAGLVTPDGMPLVWLSRLHGRREVQRVYGPDLLLAVCARSVARGDRHFFYGGAEGVAAELAETLARRFPGLRVAGSYSPPFRPLSADEDREIVARINAAAPDIVWVGLGAPKQDLWMAAHRAALDAPVLIGVGAAFDFHTGRKSQAPRWMQRAGLEWLFRLLSEPRRLWYRYLVYNPLFICFVALQSLGLRRYPPLDEGGGPAR